MIKTPLSTMIGGAFWTPGATILGSSSKNLTQLIKSLFSLGEQGFAYDPNDLTTLYQDAAGTIPVTAAGQPVGLMLDKSKGMVLGGEINQNPTFNKNLTGWATLTGTSAVFDNGEARITLGGTLGASVSNWFKLDGAYVLGKIYAVSFDATYISGGDLQAGFGYAVGLTVLAAQNSGIKKTYSFTSSGVVATPAGLLAFAASTAGSVWKIDNVSVKEVLGNHAYQTVSASRPVLQRNATTGAYYLAFDGTDDFLQTNNIDFTITDKVSLFAGVRKLSDVNTGIVAELSTRAGTSLGAFVLYAPFDPMNKGYGFRSVGTLESTTMGALPLSPTSNVLAAKSSIAQDTLTLRVDSLQYGVLTQDQGTGNYGNYPLYIGRRGGTSLPFNGHLYGLIGIGRLTTDSETIALEKAIAKNTGVTLNV